MCWQHVHLCSCQWFPGPSFLYCCSRITALLSTDLDQAYIMHTFYWWMYSMMSYRPWYILLHTQSASTDVSFCNISQTSAIAGENLHMQLSIPKMTSQFFLNCSSGMCISACTFLRSWLTPCKEVTSPKKGMILHLKGHIVLKFQMCLPAYPKQLVQCCIMVPV